MGKLRSSGRSAMVETYLVGVCQLKITSFQTSRNDFASKESLFFNRIINNYIIYGQFSSDGRDILGLFLPLQGLSRAYK